MHYVATPNQHLIAIRERRLPQDRDSCGNELSIRYVPASLITCPKVSSKLQVRSRLVGSDRSLGNWRRFALTVSELSLPIFDGGAQAKLYTFAQTRIRERASFALAFSRRNLPAHLAFSRNS